jgi:hypothetical protein
MKAVRAGLVGLLALVLVAGGGLAALFVAQAVPGFQPFGWKSETTTTQIVQAVKREEQIVLLSLAIQGITEKKQGPTVIFGIEVPGSERATFMQYDFKAKVGIDGKDVQITPNGDNAYKVTVPKFIFIGHSNEEFKLAVENNGVLSWTSPEINKLEMINAILSDEEQQKYVTGNEKLLREQTEAFYRGIISGVDPTVSLKFDYA